MQTKKTPPVLSPHLVSPKSAEISEFEFGMMVCWNAFVRWVEKGTASTGINDLNFMDIIVLHMLKSRATNKKLADICYLLNLSDTHTVSYSLKKLTSAKLITGKKAGKEVLFSTTEAGEEAISRYRDVRDQCLIPNITDDMNPSMAEMARYFGRMSGVYEQAARTASALKP